MATHPSILAWRRPWTEEPCGATVHGVAKGQTRLKINTHTYTLSLWGFLGDFVVKNPPAYAGDAGSIPGSGRSPGEGNCNLF